MATDADLWFIRLPDGRVLRAKNTEQLRRYLKTGGIPWDSRVRRSTEAPWQTLDDVEAFADLVPRDSAPEAATPAAAQQKAKASASGDMRTLGMRGLVDELINAVDSCLQENKLITAGLTGLGIGITLLFRSVALPILADDMRWVGNVVAGAVLLILFSICTSILTQLTALEMSRFRPAHLGEIRGGVFRYALRIFAALGLIGGALVSIIVLLRWLPVAFALGDGHEPAWWHDAVLNVIHGARLIVEAICWPIFGLAGLLMGPTLIVEEYSIARGMSEWLGMLRKHLGRIYLYQAVAFAFAAVMTLPLLGPVLLAFGVAPATLSLGESVTFYLLLGVSLTPMLAYLLVAHVFIYLNLRYEFFYSTRER